MRENWDRAIESVLAWEGGYRYIPPRDAVNKGIELQTYRDWCEQQDKPKPTIEDLENISEDEAKQLYWKLYALPISFNHLPAGYDLAMLHAAIMDGVMTAQRLNILADGDIGLLIILLMQHKMSSKSVVKFGPGWAARYVAIYKTAHALAAPKRRK